MEKIKNPRIIAIAVIIIFHFIGLVGMLSPWRSFFIGLTPLNLMLSLIILLSFHKKWDLGFILTMIGIMLAGYFIEVLGVNTGFPFGDYSYGRAFGPQWLGTPFMIGVNWFIMAYCGALLFFNATASKVVNAILAGITITLIDIILEPVAIAFEFWTWESSHVPIQNYVTWAICISIFSYILYIFQGKEKNPLSNWILGVQAVFFVLLLIGNSL